MHDLNYIAVLVAGVVIFMLGGLWYSPVLFAKPWVRLQGKTMEEMQAMAKGGVAASYAQVFLCGLITAWVLAVIIHFTGQKGWMAGAHIALLCWLGFAGATSYGTALFSYKPRALWAIDTGFNLVSMVVAGAIVGGWQ